VVSVFPFPFEKYILFALRCSLYVFEKWFLPFPIDKKYKYSVFLGFKDAFNEVFPGLQIGVGGSPLKR